MADWLAKPENKDQWPDGFDPINKEKDEKDAFVRHKCWVYNQSWLQDSDLWEQFKEDFDKWTAQLFDEVNKTHLRNLRSALRKYGVWVHKSNRPPKLNDALYKCLQEEEPTAWTILEIQQTIPKDGEFKLSVTPECT